MAGLTDEQIDAMCRAFLAAFDTRGHEFVGDARGDELDAMTIDGTFDLRAGMRAAVDAVIDDVVSEAVGEGIADAMREAEERS